MHDLRQRLGWLNRLTGGRSLGQLRRWPLDGNVCQEQVAVRRLHRLLETRPLWRRVGVQVQLVRAEHYVHRAIEHLIARPSYGAGNPNW